MFTVLETSVPPPGQLLLLVDHAYTTTPKAKVRYFKRKLTDGPELPSTIFARAAAQLRQTGHSSIAQHFRRVKVGRADEA